MSDASYGGDLSAAMLTWFHEEFLSEFYKKYGDGAAIAVVIFDNDAELDWQSPLGIGTDHLVLSNVGNNRRRSELLDNICGKLRFVLRTGRPSADARHRPDLIEPGDFPFEGAGTYMNRTGGASGLMEESDWWVFKRVVEQYNKLRAQMVMPAFQACMNRDRNVPDNDTKFLRGLKIA